MTTEVKDPWGRRVLQAYQSYWWHALKAPSKRDTRESELLRRLRKLLGQPAQEHDLNSLESLLSALVRSSP